MQKKDAEKVVIAFEKRNGPTISLSEAMGMTKVNTDGNEMYAFQKGDVTFLAWFNRGKVIVKTQAW